MNFLQKFCTCPQIILQRKVGRPKKEAAAILDLPVDVVLLIADRLPQHSLYTLAQTCCAMRTILKTHRGLDYSILQGDRYETLKYLMCLANNSLDVYVCEDCVKLHRVRFSDFPQVQLSNRQPPLMLLGCPFPQFCQCQRCSPLQECRCQRHGTREFYFRRAHAQIALKYFRLIEDLGHVHRRYLARLLTTVRVIAAFETPASRQYRLSSSYSMRPRIVGGQFLLLLEFRYKGGPGYDWMSPMAQGLCSFQVAAGETWQNAPATRYYRGDGAFEVLGLCRYCGSNFSYCQMRGYVFVRIWQDLGVEEAVPHACCIPGIEGRRLPYDSIRRLYESADRGDNWRSFLKALRSSTLERTAAPPSTRH